MNGLQANGLLLSTAGLTTMSYLVRCALPAGATITQQDKNGVSHSFTGELGMAPQWATSACDQDCQQQLTACMLAHVNTTGQHISLWMDGDSPALGWGQSASFPFQEGSFFGNIFASPPIAYYCNGKDFDQGVVPGRLGANQVGAPYANPFTASSPGGYCKNACTPQDMPNQNDGYKACYGFNHVVTVWRNFDPSTDYKICSRNGGMCMDIAGSSTTAGGNVIQSAYNSANNFQRWRIAQVAPGNYTVTNRGTGYVMDIYQKKTANGTTVINWPSNGGTNQMWSFTATGDGYYRITPVSNAASCVDVTGKSTTAGTLLEEWTYNAGTNQQWSIVPAT